MREEGRKEDKVWAITYRDRHTAEEVYHTLRRLKSDNLCAVKFLDPESDQPTMLIEEGYENFQQWVRKRSPIWEYNFHTTEVLCI